MVLIYSNGSNKIVDASIVEITSSNDDEEVEIDPQREISKSHSPEPLSPVPIELDIVFNKKVSQTLDRSNVDFNQPFEEFLNAIYSLLAKKTKQTKEVIANSSIIFQWLWMSVAMSQRKTLPRFKALDNEEHYQAIQQDIRGTARKNPRFDNMVLRIQVDIKVNSENEGDTIEPNDELSIRERSVVPFINVLILECKRHSN
jgi:hypothetical protein